MQGMNSTEMHPTATFPIIHDMGQTVVCPMHIEPVKSPATPPTCAPVRSRAGVRPIRSFSRESFAHAPSSSSVLIAPLASHCKPHCSIISSTAASSRLPQPDPMPKSYTSLMIFTVK